MKPDTKKKKKKKKMVLVTISPLKLSEVCRLLTEGCVKYTVVDGGVLASKDALLRFAGNLNRFRVKRVSRFKEEEERYWRLWMVQHICEMAIDAS